MKWNRAKSVENPMKFRWLTDGRNASRKHPPGTAVSCVRARGRSGSFFEFPLMTSGPITSRTGPTAFKHCRRVRRRGGAKNRRRGRVRSPSDRGRRATGHFKGTNEIKTDLQKKKTERIRVHAIHDQTGF